MCGIAGVIAPHPLADADIERARALSRRLAHRGPDGDGEHLRDGVMLTHRRLSIVDLAGGAQPLFNEARDCVLVANAEIYNHVELREELVRRGHVFRTRSDCEVILHLYEELGPACVERLRGMFAFALHDTRKGKVFLARDRLGEKPLFVARARDAMWFSSELVPLAQTLGSLDVDPQAIADYFCFQFTLGARTPFQGVERLPPATVLTVDTRTGAEDRRAYWSLVPHEPPREPSASVEERLDEVGRLLVRADVRVGVALSGGVDSALVAALAARSLGGELHALTIGYDQTSGDDERPQAAALAAHLGIRHTCVELRTEDVIADFPDLVARRGEPIADIAGAGYDALARKARETDTRVLLFGHGGDELFWGYPWVQRAARRALIADVSRASDQASSRRLYHSLADFAFSKAVRRRLWGAAMRGVRIDEPEAALPASGARADLAFTAEIVSAYLRENGLTQTDRLAMRHGVEPRLPLVDASLVDDVIARRWLHSDAFERAKGPLRAAAARRIPAHLLPTRKRGFTPPVARWHEALFARYGALLDGGLLVQLGVLDSAAATIFKDGPRPRREGATPLAFKALVLELWLRGVRGERTAQASAPRPARATPPRDKPAPVAVAAFRRPEHLRHTLSSLARCATIEDTDVFIYVDGPRSGADEAAVAATRSVAHSFTTARSTVVIERETNWGLLHSMEQAVREQVDTAGKVIVVEDDLELSPAFLGFMQAALRHYAHDERVMQVAGYMHAANLRPQRCVLLPLTSSWGWATWARAWDRYDHDMRASSSLVGRERRHAFDLQGAFPYYDMLQRERAFLQDSWAIRWQLAAFAHDGLVATPTRSLVVNRGFDGSGTHTFGRGGDVRIAQDAPVTFPRAIEVDAHVYAAVRHALMRRSARDRVVTAARRAATDAAHLGERVVHRIDERLDPLARLAALLPRRRARS